MWRLHTAQVTHQLGGTFGNKRALFAKFFSISNTVIAFIRGTESRIFLSMSHPVKTATVYDRAAQCSSMSIHIFCGGVSDDICTPFEWTAVHRSREGIIHNQRYIVCMSNLCKQFNVQNCQCRIGNGLTKHQLRIWLECCIQFIFRSIRRNERGRDSHLLQGHCNQIKSAAVDRRGSYDVIATFTDIKQRKKVGRLTGGSQHGSSATLHGSNLGSHIIIRRILKSGIKISRCLQIEKLSHVFAGTVLKRGGLDNRDLSRFTVSRCIAGLYTFGAHLIVIHNNLLKLY